MDESLTYGQLHSALTELGFRKSTIDEWNVVYRHADSKTNLYYPKLPRKELVRPILVTSTRKVLIERGIIDAARLDELFHASAA